MKIPPGLKFHDHSAQYRAWLHGEYRYFGKDVAEAIKRYGAALAQIEFDGFTVAEVIVQIQTWANKRYKPSGRWGGGAKLMKYALGWLDTTVEIQSPRGPSTEVVIPELPVESFSVIHLAAVRQQMIDDGKSRSYINATIGRIQHGFAQMRPLGYVSREVVADLKTLTPLPAGCAGVKDTERVTPVDDETLEAVLPHMSAQMAAICRVLRLTGMRPAECLAMRVSNLDVSGELWILDLGTKHKTGRGGKSKRIYLGPQAQKIIKPFLDAAKATMRTDAPVWPNISPRAGTDTVSVSSIRDAIELACNHAGKPQFTTYQLRHASATAEIEREALRLVRAKLGQSSDSSARVYAELDAIAREQARLSG